MTKSADRWASCTSEVTIAVAALDGHFQKAVWNWYVFNVLVAVLWEQALVQCNLSQPLRALPK